MEVEVEMATVMIATPLTYSQAKPTKQSQAKSMSSLQQQTAWLLNSTILAIHNVIHGCCCCCYAAAAAAAIICMLLCYAEELPAALLAVCVYYLLFI